MVDQDWATRRCVAGARRIGQERGEQLSTILPEWRREGETLVRWHRFSSYLSVLGFLQELAAIAEAQDHHPDVDWRYDRVRIALTTHDAGGLTENDLILASLIEKLISTRAG